MFLHPWRNLLTCTAQHIRKIHLCQYFTHTCRAHLPQNLLRIASLGLQIVTHITQAILRYQTHLNNGCIFGKHGCIGHSTASSSMAFTDFYRTAITLRQYFVAFNRVGQNPVYARLSHVVKLSQTAYHCLLILWQHKNTTHQPRRKHRKQHQQRNQ